MKYAFLILLVGLGHLWAAPPLAEVETIWPGVKFQVMNAQRIDPSHVLFTVRVTADRTARASVLVASRPALAIPDGASAEEIDSGKYEAIPFTLVGGKLTDEITGKVYESLSTLPVAPFVGPNSALTNLDPGSAVQMAVYFSVPPPLPKNAEGVTPPQKVTIQFPKAAKPLTGFILPAEVIKPVS